MPFFQSILYLDDVRIPTLPGVDLVRSFAEFTEYLAKKPVPDLISFDHDLAREHYPVGSYKSGQKLPYATYSEGTGLHCAQFIVENKIDLRHWAVHSSNVEGKKNIERELRRYRRQGETRGFPIPFRIQEPEGEVEQPERLTAANRLRFSSTSLLQFQDDVPLESWEKGPSRSFSRIW